LRYNIADIPTAIELALFDAQRIGGSIEVRWQLAATNVADKVTLERSLTQEGPWTTAFVQEGESGTLIVATIPDVDPTVGGYYRLRVQEIGGQYRIFGPIELTASRSNLIPTLSVWPQPARSAIEMRFVLPTTDYVRLDIMDIQGRIVASPVAGVVREGSHVLAWKPQKGRSLASGLYFIRFVTSRYTATSRLTIVR
jgi:hypothetical protein